MGTLLNSSRLGKVFCNNHQKNYSNFNFHFRQELPLVSFDGVFLHAFDFFLFCIVGEGVEGCLLCCSRSAQVLLRVEVRGRVSPVAGRG